MGTNYSCKREHLLLHAEQIERDAKESQLAWIILEQCDKYSAAMEMARHLRAAAAERRIAVRREMLRWAGITLK